MKSISEKRSVSANSTDPFNIECPDISGYKPLGVVGFEIDHSSLVWRRIRLSGTQVRIAINNPTSMGASGTVFIDILYIKQ